MKCKGCSARFRSRSNPMRLYCSEPCRNRAKRTRWYAKPESKAKLKEKRAAPEAKERQRKHAESWEQKNRARRKQLRGSTRANDRG